MKYIDDANNLEEQELGYEDEIIELENDEGVIVQFYLVGSIDYENKTYAFFQPAEEVDGVAPEEVVVFEVGENLDELIEIEDKDLEKKLLEEFSNDYLGEYISEDEYLN